MARRRAGHGAANGGRAWVSAQRRSSSGKARRFMSASRALTVVGALGTRRHRPPQEAWRSTCRRCAGGRIRLHPLCHLRSWAGVSPRPSIHGDPAARAPGAQRGAPRPAQCHVTTLAVLTGSGTNSRSKSDPLCLRRCWGSASRSRREIETHRAISWSKAWGLPWSHLRFASHVARSRRRHLRHLRRIPSSR